VKLINQFQRFLRITITFLEHEFFCHISEHISYTQFKCYSRSEVIEIFCFTEISKSFQILNQVDY